MSADPDTLSFPITLRYDHRAVFTRDVFAPANDTLARLLTPRDGRVFDMAAMPTYRRQRRWFRHYNPLQAKRCRKL